MERKILDVSLDKMLKTLKNKVKPEHTALLVIDMQNDFCAEGGMLEREGGDVSLVAKIVPNLQKLIRSAKKVGAAIIFVQNIQSAKVNYLSDVWLEQNMRMWKGGRYIRYAVCEKNAWGSEFFDGINPEENDYIVVKHRYDAFEGTDLDSILRSNGIRTIIVTGTATNVCVESTVRSGFVKEYYVVLPEDCTASLNKEVQECSLFTIDKWFGQVVNSAEIIESWK